MLTPIGDLELGEYKVYNYAKEAVAAVLPALPESDGTYSLQLVIDDGAATFTWEAAEDSGAE